MIQDTSWELRTNIKIYRILTRRYYIWKGHENSLKFKNILENHLIEEGKEINKNNYIKIKE